MLSEGFLSHIEALRKMILEVLGIFILLLIPGWCFADEVLHLLQSAAVDIARKNGAESFDLRYFTLMEPFLVELKAGMLIALFAGLPLYFWRIWRFLAPALYRHEKRILLWGSVAAWLLFAAGAALGIFGVMPMLVKFSLGFARDGLSPLIGFSNFVGLMMTIALAFGVMFELPLLLLALAVAGIISLDSLRKQRPLVVVIILILAAILTPPDVISQLMLGLPTYLLFELTLLVGKILIKERNDPPQATDLPPGGDTEAAFTDSGETDESEAFNNSSIHAYYRRRIRRRPPERGPKLRYKKK
ncbi:MAG: twin-arginine translocase subunit TatC [Lentisphaerae bacterium]|nr:twin-arginine translocase subunit TatC [Lentisphaerota bacterium]